MYILRISCLQLNWSETEIFSDPITNVNILIAKKIAENLLFFDAIFRHLSNTDFGLSNIPRCSMYYLPTFGLRIVVKV